MLVCNVSLRSQRKAIAAEIVEIGAAAEDLLSDAGFGLLIDAPALASEVVDAFMGEIMLEVASANSVVTVVSVYTVASDEGASANDIITVTIPYTVLLNESATADDLPDASIAPAVTARHAMVAGPLFINSDGTLREANANGTMINL